MSLNLAALENRMMERIRTEVFIEGNSVGFTTTKRIGTVRPVFRR